MGWEAHACSQKACVSDAGCLSRLRDDDLLVHLARKVGNKVVRQDEVRCLFCKG